MSEFIINYESPIRLFFFLSVFAIMALIEIIHPFREQEKKAKFGFRWLNNLAMVIINTLILRLIFPAAAVGFAVFAEQHELGLFNFLNLSGFAYAAAFILSFLILDFVIYAQHVIFHKIPILWSLHQMHHSDTEYDLTTGLRFHPIEILLSMLIKAAIIFILGAPVAAVILFETILNASSVFNHANFTFPVKIEHWLRKFIVTPDMHRIHHSVHHRETDSNYGFNFSFWDRICGTYIDSPQEDPKQMKIGLNYFRQKKNNHIIGMLLQPLTKKFKQNNIK